MKFRGWKKRCLIASLICIIAGGIISGIGYGCTGFSPEAYVNQEGNPWYRTLYFGY